MKKILLSLIIPLALHAQSIQSLSVPSSSATTLTQVSFLDASHRYEFRIHNFTPATGADRHVIENCWIIANTLSLTCFDGNDGGPNGIPSVDLTGRTDVRVRFQRDRVNAIQEIEVWNGDGSIYASNIKRVTTGGSAQSGVRTAALGQGGMSIAFLRHYSTVLPVPGPIPTEVLAAPANLMDFEFNNNSLADSSGKGNTISLGGASFARSPTYPPYPEVTRTANTLTVRAGAPATLDGSGSFSSIALSPSLTWQQLSGPASGVIQSPHSVTTTFTPPVAGTYTIQLAATDPSGTATATVTVGAVATDQSGIIVTGNAAMDTVLGPLTQSGTDPWPWYDITEHAVADALYPYQTAPPAGTPPLAGTVTVPTSCCQVTVVGTGTHFTADLAVNGLVWLWWDATGPGSGTGRYLTTVKSIPDDTHFTVIDYYYSRPLSASVNIHYSKPVIYSNGSTSVDGWARLSQPGNTWNYYDNILGLYRLYYRTGQSVYLNQARTFCGLWWMYALDYGYGAPPPRNSGIHGLIACAVDQHPEYWPGLLLYLSQYGYLNPTSPLPLATFLYTADVRESSYELRGTALVAMLHPDRNTRATYCTYVANQVQNLFLANQDPRGYFPEDLFSQNPVYPAKDINGVYGTSPWRTEGLATLALQRAYAALADPNGCNDSVLAATTLTAIQNLADFIWNYGRSADGGELYDVLYETSTDANNAAYSDSTVTVTRGSNRVVGSGTQFLTRLAPCNGTSYIGIYSATQTYRKTYNVASCTDNTHITLSVNYANPTETVTTWATALRATANCAPSIDSYCDPDPFNGRNLAADGIAAEGWLYWKTGAPRWLAQSQYFAGKAYGGPAGGPGTTGPAAGPDADGGTNNFTDALPPCGGPPCGGYGPAIGQGKAFGMNAGAGDAPNALAYMRGGAPQIMIRALSVAVDLASFPAGTSALVTVVQPSGQTDQTACPASPCEVTVDAQQGDHLMTIDYLSPAGNVIGPGKPTTLKVRP